MKDSVWIVTTASSSNENFGPTYIALEVNDGLLEIIRCLKQHLGKISKNLNSYGRITWFAANVCIFDDSADGPLSDMLEELGEEGPLVLPPNTDLVSLLPENPEWREELCGITVYSEIGDTHSVYARCVVKHADITIESSWDLQVAIDKIADEHSLP